jgi:hypothetical protein
MRSLEMTASKVRYPELELTVPYVQRMSIQLDSDACRAAPQSKAQNSA